MNAELINLNDLIYRDTTPQATEGLPTSNSHWDSMNTVRFKGPCIERPIPLSILKEAREIGLAAMNVMLALWYWSAEKQSFTFKVRKSKIGKGLGIPAGTVRTGLKQLEAAGMIRVAEVGGAEVDVEIRLKESWVER